MDIFLSINNREGVIQLPIVPSEFVVKSSNKNSLFETVSSGDLKLIGLRGLDSISISSYFPVKKYSFARSNALMGWEYVKVLKYWIKRREPIRIIISDTTINMAVAIEKFEYGVRDGSGDIYYTLELEEFRFVS